MKILGLALCTSLSVAVLVGTLAWTRPVSAQTVQSTTASRFIGATFSGTSIDGNVQAALDAALAKADAGAAAGPNGTVVADAQYSWQLTSILGTRGGFAGRREVTVNVQILK